ncbi:Zinc finger CCCH domain-containing protein 6 [Merluccius polli]|uniref:Zinc finger CCCH domain-containing protein 6 n=1 Tax=Merluccius polli TaxID=89951 RepID=A0AA47P711_MERPO|nr:Zinc finger CCCH domain-containing protein 6 [Merluccius polli]
MVAPVENGKEDANIHENGYISVCSSLGLLCVAMAAVYRRDHSRAGSQAVLAELKLLHIFQHLLTTTTAQRLLFWVTCHSLWYRRKREADPVSTMASVSLVSSPQTPVLDKNMTDCELAGDERSMGNWLLRVSIVAVPQEAVQNINQSTLRHAHPRATPPPSEQRRYCKQQQQPDFHARVLALLQNTLASLEDGELEDGEIDDEGIGIEEEKETKEAHDDKEKERDFKEKDKDKERDAHRHSRKRYKKTREKRKSKRRRRDRQKHHSPSSGSSSDSYDSDYDRPEKPKNRKGPGSNQEPNGQSSQHGRESKGGLHGNCQKKSPQPKSGDFDKYSDYSNDKYDYEGEQGDYEDDGSEFQQSKDLGGFGGGQGMGRHGKDQMKRSNQRGLQKQQQQQYCQRGRGRGSMLGRGRGMLKNKKLKGKGWGGRGRGQGGDQGMEGGPQDGKNTFQKKRPIMSKEFINQHTVEHNGRYICKYFLEGRCIKIISTEEENAHEDEIELENLRKQGIAPLPKPPPGVGLLPTPGHSSPQEAGASGQAGKKIPSLFEIHVQPTVDLVQKIASLRRKARNQRRWRKAELPFPRPPALLGLHQNPPGPMAHPTAGPPPGPLSPPGQQPPPLHGFTMPPPPFPPGHPPPFLGNRPPMSSPPPMNMGLRPPFPPMPDLQMLQSLFPFPPLGQNPVELFSNLLRSQTMSQGVDPSVSFLQSLQQQMGTESQMQSLPPADETTNWYSSDEEDGGCVSSILKSLKKQNELHQRQQAQPGPPTLAALATVDPRLLKERAPPSDPRVKTDPRQRHPDPKKEPDGASDPRLARDPRKVRPVAPPSPYRQQKPPPSSHKPPAGEDDEEGERELRDRAALIPLDLGPGVVLRDPRTQLQQFSHIHVDVVLQRPAFAHAVVWGPEDLLPSLVPKQEHSINLPLPPLVADAQMNRVNLLDPPPAPAPAAIDPRAVAARLKEGVVRMPPSRNLETRSLDPRQLKALDPRLKRTGSLDSKPPLQKEGSASGGGVVGDPRLRAGAGSSPGSSPAVRSKPEAEKLPPYAPRLASSSGGGLESPTTLLGGISLYDPRNQTTEHAQKEQAEGPKKTGILKHHPVKKDNTPPTPPPQPPPSSSSSLSPTQGRGSAEENKTADSASDGSPPHQSPGALSPGPPVAAPVSPVKPPAVHNLPVQALAILIRPQYADPRQAKPGGQGSVAPPGDAEDSNEEQGKKEKEEKEEATKAGPKEAVAEEDDDDDRTLKDVFKTFDPTASPFCQ